MMKDRASRGDAHELPAKMNLEGVSSIDGGGSERAMALHSGGFTSGLGAAARHPPGFYRGGQGIDDSSFSRSLINDLNGMPRASLSRPTPDAVTKKYLRDRFDEMLAEYQQREYMAGKAFTSDERGTPPNMHAGHQRRDKGVHDRKLLNRADKLTKSAQLGSRGIDVMS